VDGKGRRSDTEDTQELACDILTIRISLKIASLGDDFNADGKADILWQNADGTPAVWLMDGTNVVAGANAGANPGAAWHEIPQHHDLV
jgi:hypothetical protein